MTESSVDVLQNQYLSLAIDQASEPALAGQKSCDKMLTIDYTPPLRLMTAWYFYLPIAAPIEGNVMAA